jgi:Domain of unknown function (DUF4260)
MTAVQATSARAQLEAAISRPTLDRQTRTWLRLEGLAALVAGAIAYNRLGGDWLWFIPAMLAVDISAVGYLRGTKTGAIVYDLFHNWAIGLAVLGLGLAFQVPVVDLAGTVLIAHTGMDRFVGYGMKLMTGFGDTHLGHMGKATATDRSATDESASSRGSVAAFESQAR